MEPGSLDATTCASEGCAGRLGFLVCAEVAFAAGVMAFLTVHEVHVVRQLTMQRVREAVCNLIRPLHTTELSEQMSKQRLKMAAYLLGPILEALRLTVLTTMPMRIATLLATGAAFLPTPAFLAAAALAVTSVIYKQQLEAHATLVVKGALLLYCLLAMSVATMRRGESSERFLALALSVRLGAALFATPVESFLFSTYIMLVNIVEMHSSEEVTITSSMRCCFRELLCLIVTLMMTRRIIELQATAAEETLKAKELRRTSNAATNLVKARTDAVLQLDESLHVVEPHWQLAAMLGADVPALGGSIFENFLPLDEDRQRFQSMCKLAGAEESYYDNDAQVVDMIHVSVQNSCKSVTFSARLFHVPIHVSGERGHLIGICRTNRRGEPQNMPELLDAPPAQTLELPTRSHLQARSAASSNSRSSQSSSRSSRVARASAHGGGGGSVRALVNAMSESLDILSASEAFMDFCDPTETEHLEVYFADAGPAFTTWLQESVQRAMNQNWDPRSFTRQKFGDMVLSCKKDGATYNVNVTVTIPDPFIADQLDGYPVSVFLEKCELKFQHPRRDAPASFGHGVLRQTQGLEALPESESEACTSGS